MSQTVESTSHSQTTHLFVMRQDSGKNIVSRQDGSVRAAQRQKWPSPKVTAVALAGRFTQPSHRLLISEERGKSVCYNQLLFQQCLL